jgi:hypothetical protein
MRTSKLVRDVCAMPVQANKAVVGSNAFAHSSGIHQDGVLKFKSTYEIMTPQSIGLKDNKMNLTSRSGSHMVRNRLESLGYREKDIDIETFHPKFKALADKKGTVYDDDLVALMEADTIEEMADTYKLEYLNVTGGMGVIPTATVRIVCDGKSKEEAASGDGVVDATTKAIDRVVGFKIEVKDYHLDAISEGREALGRVKIVAVSPEGTFTGIGTSTDIVEASAKAYMDVVNKICACASTRERGVELASCAASAPALLSAWRKRRPTRKAWAWMWGNSALLPARSDSKVSSAPMLFASRSGTTWRGSIPHANSHRSRPPAMCLASQSGSAAAICPTVRSSSVASAASVLGPTPHRRPTGKGARNTRASPGATSFCPLGLAKSQAILATNLTEAMPADDGKPTSVAIRSRRLEAIRPGGPNRLTEAVTSKNASSRERGSISGVTVLKMAKTASLAASYAVMRGGTTTAVGARRMATTMGMAECTPNGLTS